jgi:hypothetical protein
MISQKIPAEVTLVLDKVKKKLPGNYLLLLCLLLLLILGYLAQFNFWPVVLGGSTENQ